MESFFPKWVEDINTGFSILGFLITLYVAYEIREIKSSFLSKARLPEYIKDLKTAGSNLSTSLNNWPAEKNSAHEQIKIAVTILSSSSSIIPRRDRSTIDETIKKLKLTKNEFHSNPKCTESSHVWDLYGDIQSCITCMTQVSKNMKWE